MYLHGACERRTGSAELWAPQLRALRVQIVLRVHDNRGGKSGHQAPSRNTVVCQTPVILQPSLREREVSMIIITNNLFVTVFIILIISPAGKLSCTDDKAEWMIIWCWWCYKHPQLITWTFQVYLTYYWMAVITSKIKCTDTDTCMYMYWNVLFYSAFVFNKIKCMSFH